MRLAGARVVLRASRPEDADVLAQGFADDPTLGAMLGMEPGEENAEWLRATVPKEGLRREEHKAFWFAMTDPGTAEVIGEIGLVAISWPNRRAGISVMVLPAARRRGVAREAMELLAGWAHSELGLHRLEVHTLPENAPMQRLAEATGFVREGVLRDYGFERGGFVDNVVYARLPG